MSFAENLKQFRRERCLSQEELAEMLGVSRQAVSKWESDMGYPEVETLLRLANKLNLSLDCLMSVEPVQEACEEKRMGTGSITIRSPHENAVVTCYKVLSSQKMKGIKSSPKYALFGVCQGGSTFWGEATTFLGWYADKEQITKEVSEIQNAIANGDATYTLRYSAKTERKWMRIKILNE